MIEGTMLDKMTRIIAYEMCLLRRSKGPVGFSHWTLADVYSLENPLSEHLIAGQNMNISDLVMSYPDWTSDCP
jgi:hypothetical protein